MTRGLSNPDADERLGDWITTHSGVHFWPLDPRPEEILVRDIAHALSLINRFNGHLRCAYSVGQHCVLASQRVPDADAKWALLHDASEAYICDLARPLKALPEFNGYRIIERKLMAAVCQRFDLPEDEPPSVSDVDRRLLVTEARDLFESPQRWTHIASPYPDVIEPWTADRAEAEFLKRCGELGVR